MNAIVWSKHNCPACEKAKALLKNTGIDFEVRTINGSAWTQEHLLAEVPNARSVPQIFINETYVGGFAELEKYLEEHKTNAY